MKSPSNNALPRERSGWRRWLWLHFTVALAGVVGLTGVTLVNQVTVEGSRVYIGTVRPSTQFSHVMLPANVPLKTILVREGETVTAGQTVALIDSELLTARVAELRRDLLVRSSLRECLLNRNVVAETGGELTDLDGETRLQVQTAMRECQVAHRENALRQRRLIDARDLLIAQMEDADNTLALQSMTLRETKAQRLLEARLERARAATRLARLELEISAMATDQERDLLARAKQLESEARTVRLTLAAFEAQLKTPRLQAQQNGKIERVRGLRDGSVFLQDTVLMTLANVDGGLFITQFDLPPSVAGRIQEGDAINVFLNDGSKAAVEGRVAEILPVSGGAGSDGAVRLRVDLPETDFARLHESAKVTAWGDNQTQAQIRMRVAPQSLMAILLRHTRLEEVFGTTIDAVKSILEV